MRSTIADAQHYLADVLPGAVSDSVPWQSPALPYFLLDAFEFSQITVHGHPAVLAVPRQDIPLQTLQRMLVRLRNLAGGRILYVTQHLTAYERKRLLAERIEFVVPGSQLFAPSLAMDLRETTASSAPPSEVLHLGPATQAMLIALLLSPEGVLPTLSVARDLGYSPMSASRANRELEAAGLVRVNRVGSRSMLTLSHNRSDVWSRARPLMASPIAKQLHVMGPKDRLMTAGESALSDVTLLSHSSDRVLAVSQNDWRAIENAFTICREPEADSFRLQVWRYHTGIFDSAAVDPLSLILSLQDEPDERVQIALDELERSTWRRFTD